MHNRALYIGMKIEGQPRTGGEYVQTRNRAVLQYAFDKVDIIEIPRISLLYHATNLLLGRSYGYSNKLRHTIDKFLMNKYDMAFADSSAYGGYVEYFRNHGLKTIVFCHNVEYEYYKAKLESDRSIMNRALVPYIMRQERISMQNATAVVTLNHRDTEGLKLLYGREADFEIPISYEKISIDKLENNKTSSDYLLFVGADFFANTDGIVWFIKNVSNQIRYKLYVVGGCCNTVSKMIDLADYPNVRLMGFVDDLDLVYKNALGVVCPIFAGSGMKTKTIEALKFGKNIFGTAEAFEGIECDYYNIGGLCSSADDFINAINKKTLGVFNPDSYNLFVNGFSTEAVFPKFKEFIYSVIKSLVSC